MCTGGKERFNALGIRTDSYFNASLAEIFDRVLLASSVFPHSQSSSVSSSPYLIPGRPFLHFPLIKISNTVPRLNLLFKSF